MPQQQPSDLGQRNLRAAILWILASCFCFAAMWAVIRLASVDLHPFVLVFWRNLIGPLIMLPLLLRSGTAWLRTTRITAHMRRATSGIIATLATFYAVANTPMATAIAISYATPLITTIAAVLFFGETIRARRVAALVVGFAGVLIVVRPGHVPLSHGIMAALVAVVSTAFSLIAVKQLTATEDSRAIVFYSFLLMVPPSFLSAWPVWQWPHGFGWLLVSLIALLAVLGQTTMVRAYALAETSALLPYDFVRFMLIIAIGIIWFGERLDVYTLFGGAIILGSTLYLAHRERVAAHSQKPTSAPKDIG
jgi:drug/metabolite transporter (DMT)-like permease